MSSFAVVITGIWGGLMALERRAFLQAMVSRPLVAATATGALLDDVTAGLSVGVVFELLHLGGVSLGGAHPEHDTLPAIMGAALAASIGHASGSDSTPAMWSAAILLCAPFGRVGKLLENRLDARASRYFGRAVTAASQGELSRAARQNLRAMWPHFVFYGALCSVAALAGPMVLRVEERLPHDVLRGLAWAWPAMGVSAAAVAVHASHAPKRLPIAFVSVVLVVGALLLTGKWS